MSFVVFVVDIVLSMNAEVAKPTYYVTRRVFLSLLGVVYLIAFLSLWNQILGLIGSNGIIPAEKLVEAIHKAVADEKMRQSVGYWDFPSVCLLYTSDGFLHGLCAIGVVASLCLAWGIAPIIALVILWVDYLSIASVCSPFLNFQWDTLLLETGFLAIFLAPGRLLPNLARESPPSVIALWLQRLLLVKFMVASGVVKLTYGDPSWLDGTALGYHYETQPIPAWTSWYVHHLPVWFHQLSTYLTLLIEIALPILVFFPGKARLAPFVGFIALMATVGVTGNYGFFNMLTMVLCVLLLDDSRFPGRWRKNVPTAPQGSWQSKWARGAFVAPVAFIFLLMLVVTTVRDTMNQRDFRFPQAVEEAAAAIRSFRTINSYGLFRVMTKSRPELVLEGSYDQQEWKPYEFKWKPGDPTRAPSFVEPHMPRLDWQMWFAALTVDAGGRPPWLFHFAQRLGENAPPVVSLLESNPFSDEPPRAIRCVLYDYSFTDSASGADGGHWWQRERKRVFGVFIRQEERDR